MPNLYDQMMAQAREREQLILGYLADGKTQTEIAEILGVRPQRVNQIVARLRKRDAHKQ